MKKLVLAGILAGLAGPALAHTGVVPHSHGFVLGFTHPLFGLDHLLAMVAVGLWSAAALPGRLWLGPATFLAGMLGGAGLQAMGIALPQVEGLIALSVLALGLMTAFALRVPASAALVITGLFALGHGHAHMAEAAGDATTYLLGFLVATALIHGAGIGLGTLLLRSRYLLPATGAVIAAAGLALVAG